MKDLNLLFVFEAMWRDRSVTIAAESLGLTQAAVSSALKRLREEYKDHMFMLVGRRMEPTPYASAIAQRLLDALSMVRNTSVAESAFDPSRSNRLYTLRTRDIGEVVCLPPLMEPLRIAAPNVRLRTVFTAIEDTISGLASGRIDLALGFLPSLEAGIHRRKLFTQHYVCVMRAGHPVSGEELTVDLLRQQEHLLVEYSGSGHKMLEKALIDAGARQQIRIRLPQYLSAPHFLVSSDLVWCAPAILAQRLAPHYALITKPLPLDLPEFEIGLYWHDRYHQDGGNRWLRNFIADHLTADAG